MAALNTHFFDAWYTETKKHINTLISRNYSESAIIDSCKALFEKTVAKEINVNADIYVKKLKKATSRIQKARAKIAKYKAKMEGTNERSLTRVEDEARTTRRRLLRLKIELKKGSVKKYAKVMEEASKKLTTLSSRL